jgi:hypothetical protein
MNALARPTALLLCASLLLAVPGCRTSFEEALDVREALRAGMSREEVRDEAGDPDVILPAAEGRPETWAYLCRGGPGPVAVVFLVILALPLLPLILLTGGVNRSGAAEEQPYFVILRFDAAGRVVSISQPELQVVP